MTISAQAARLLPYANIALRSVPFLRRRAEPVSERALGVPEPERLRPMLHFEDDLARVRPMHPHYRKVHRVVEPGDVLRMVRGCEVVHQPPVRLEYRDALVHSHGFSMAGGDVWMWRRPAARFLLGTELAELDAAALCNGGLAFKYFGHWLSNALPTALLPEEGEEILLPHPGGWRHPPEYAAMTGIRPRGGRLFLVRRLSVFTDVALGSSRRARHAELRRRIAARFGPPPDPGPRVYLRRGTGGENRPVANEEEAIAALEREGFRAIEPSAMTAEEIVRALHGAEVVVGLEGSQLHHALFTMREGALLVGLIPPDRFLAPFGAYAGSVGARAGAAVLVGSFEEGYRIDVPRLLRLVEQGDAERRGAGLTA